jgi:hypothetical protein
MEKAPAVMAGAFFDSVVTVNLGGLRDLSERLATR